MSTVRSNNISEFFMFLDLLSIHGLGKLNRYAMLILLETDESRAQPDTPDVSFDVFAENFFVLPLTEDGTFSLQKSYWATDEI